MCSLKLRSLNMALRTWTRSPHKGHIQHQPSITQAVRKFSTEQEELYEDFGDYSIILPDEPFVFGVSHIEPRSVPQHIKRPPYALHPGGVTPHEILNRDSGKIKLGGEEESLLTQAGALAKKVRQFAGTQVKIGASTNDIDAAVHDFIIAHSAYPSPLLYQGFPRSCCTSVNNVAVHGIPDDRRLEDGDIINVDVTIYLNGYHGDTSETFLVGDVDEKGRELVHITNEALKRAITVCAPGRPFKDIGRTIHDYLKDKEYSVSSQFTGHGIGRVFHDNPAILHHLNDEPGVMQPGHCFTIEPVIVQGRNPKMWIFPDGWTASTENCARSAQAEHMVLITNDGIKVITR